jgi:hypothetical protein
MTLGSGLTTLSRQLTNLGINTEINSTSVLSGPYSRSRHRTTSSNTHCFSNSAGITSPNSVSTDKVVPLGSDCNFHLAQTSPVHILVNNSGGPPPGLAYQAPLNAYLAAFSHHLICNPTLLQALLEGMKRAGYGRIIVISIRVRPELHAWQRSWRTRRVRGDDRSPSEAEEAVAISLGRFAGPEEIA